MHTIIINGPNLNMLGMREKEHYGEFTYKDLTETIQKHVKLLGMSATIAQSNHEGKIVELIQQATIKNVDAIIINPAGFSHYSIAIHDALKCFNGLKIEVHLSDIKKREAFRQVLITAQACDAIVSGKGQEGYLIALDEVKRRLGGE